MLLLLPPAVQGALLPGMLQSAAQLAPILAAKMQPIAMQEVLLPLLLLLLEVVPFLAGPPQGVAAM